MFELFATKVSDGYGGFEYSMKPLGYAVMIVVFLLLLFTISALRKQERKTLFSTKQLVFAAISMALAVVTSYLKLFHAPMGGSITLCSMLFITLIGYWYGPTIGLTSAIAYGLLQLIIDPYIISIPQMLIDYIFAFGALGLSGFFCNKKHGLIKGYLLGIFGRFVFATLSGVIFFASYAPEGMSPIIYSIGYNFFYIAIEGAITVVIIAIPQVASALGQVKKYALE